jgi:hypothetical protein
MNWEKRSGHRKTKAQPKKMIQKPPNRPKPRAYIRFELELEFGPFPKKL